MQPGASHSLVPRPVLFLLFCLGSQLIHKSESATAKKTKKQTNKKKKTGRSENEATQTKFFDLLNQFRLHDSLCGDD